MPPREKKLFPAPFFFIFPNLLSEKFRTFIPDKFFKMNVRKYPISKFDV